MLFVRALVLHFRSRSSGGVAEKNMYMKFLKMTQLSHIRNNLKNQADNFRGHWWAEYSQKFRFREGTDFRGKLKKVWIKAIKIEHLDHIENNKWT